MQRRERVAREAAAADSCFVLLLSQPPCTVSAMVLLEANDTLSASGQTSDRWSLCRAGIVNVYQYENEVLHFGGGRLLLRGVNGSGKSTAMNMLLPFLLTTRQRGIDAAGEQVGILKSWMLDGRDDSQPVGYLWIEFERRGEYLACGCGVRANRASDNVSTWWFVTAKRPGIDFGLVRDGVALSPDVLRAVLDEGTVYSERQRRDYRREIEDRLFGGASIDQHIGLIHLVRDPRVGDRIDVELPQRLVDALPQLSEQALAEAAQPLDDLEEHRRNVTALERSVAAIEGLLVVYRAYCVGDLRRRMNEGAERLDALRRRTRAEEEAQRTADESEAEVVRLDEQIAHLESESRRLGTQIAALEESQAYKSGQELVTLEELVHDLDLRRAGAEDRVTACAQRADEQGAEVKAEQRCSRGDLEQLNESLADAARLAIHSGLARRPPGPVQMSEAPLDGLDANEPAAPFDASAVKRGLADSQGALSQRRGDLAEMDDARRMLDGAVEAQTSADAALETAEAAARSASDGHAQRVRALATANSEWGGRARLWAMKIRPLLLDAELDSAAVSTLANSEETTADTPQDLRTELQAGADALVTFGVNAVAACEHRLAAERAAEHDAQAVVDKLAAQTEPAPPRFEWQGAADHCIADLIDFDPHLDHNRRSGLEAALDASGLLAARLTENGSAELASGELVAVATGRVESPLSELLRVTVPDRLSGVVDVGLVADLLDSISSDTSAGVSTAVGVDGAFRIGALEGRHCKERSEFIGATARRETLERDRSDAAEVLEQARSLANATEAELSTLSESRDHASRLQSEIPGTSEIEEATGALDAAAATAEEAEAVKQDAAGRASDAERAAIAASDELQRRSVTLSLPSDHDGLASRRADLVEFSEILQRCRSQTAAVDRSTVSWSAAAGRWRTADDDLRREQRELSAIKDEHGRQNQRLDTIRRSIGRDYQNVVTERDRCRGEKTAAETRLPLVRADRDDAVERRARSNAGTGIAAQHRESAEHECEGTRQSLIEAVETPGLLEAVAFPAGSSTVEQAASARSGDEGLKDLLGWIKQLLDVEHAGGASSRVDAAADTVDINSVHQSLRQRRDTLGAGWDAEARHLGPSLPLVIEVTGPAGRAPLAQAARVASEQHRQQAGLLDQKQADALRELLQGLIATEIAEKVHGAEELVELMNERLGSVTTAHDVGVRLRWRLSPELDAPTARMVELLAKRPDLRLEDDQHELRTLLSERLDEARSHDPDGPYRQLIGEALDYKQWHEMSVMLKRGDSRETRLGRRTPLSEGEKKIVTYLTLFAAVAASHDALAAQHPDPDRPGIARFVLLDDAFAKISEDNHAALFGLIVDLDLDLVATSERLWGTHATVPQLAITEVVRDADLKTILLEHYRWDGTTMSPRAVQ